MATINGVTFNMQNLRAVAVHRNSISEQPGSDTNFITDMGYDGLVLRLEGFEETLATYDSVISEFMKSGEQTLVHRTGWQFKVYSVQLTPELIRGFADNYFPYDLILYTSTPYRESTSETTRSKSITTNNQEWSADDSANDIDTDGSVDAIPDIAVTGGTGAVYEVLTDNPLKEPGFETVVNWTYSETDTNGTLSGSQDNVNEHSGDNCYQLKLNGHINSADFGKVLQDIDLAQVKKITFWLRWITGAVASPFVDMEVYGGAQLLETYDHPGTNKDDGWEEKELVINSNLASLSFRITTTITAAIANDIECYIDDIVVYTKTPTRGPEIYNTSDTTVKCLVANTVLDGAVHRINIDGTGTVDFYEDFSDRTYAHTRHDMEGVTYDDVYDLIEIADDGYIYWFCDPKYPITGIPTLKTRVNITAGAPTIQISSDASTWYDIDTAIVDDVETTYDLVNASNLNINEDGLTSFYWRYDCVKAAAATCEVKSFELDVNLVTIDVEHPRIDTGGAANTFGCGQDADSSMICTVEFFYRDRSWPA